MLTNFSLKALGHVKWTLITRTPYFVETEFTWHKLPVSVPVD